jgi:hypothetical protein
MSSRCAPCLVCLLVALSACTTHGFRVHVADVKQVAITDSAGRPLLARGQGKATFGKTTLLQAENALVVRQPKRDYVLVAKEGARLIPNLYRLDPISRLQKAGGITLDGWCFIGGRLEYSLSERGWGRVSHSCGDETRPDGKSVHVCRVSEDPLKKNEDETTNVIYVTTPWNNVTRITAVKTFNKEEEPYSWWRFAKTASFWVLSGALIAGGVATRGGWRGVFLTFGVMWSIGAIANTLLDVTRNIVRTNVLYQRP